MSNLHSGQPIVVSRPPQATWRHRRVLANALSPKNEKWYRDECLWSFLVASLIRERPDSLVSLFCGEPRSIEGLAVCCEAEPLSARLKEGNTVVDIVFGHLVGRLASGDAHAAIGPDMDRAESWVCFVEAKFLSDLGCHVTNDPARNQMARIVENLLCFQSAGKSPSHLHFALLTPRLFWRRRTARFYGYKFRDYEADHQAIVEDIQCCRMQERRSAGYVWPDVEQRLAAMAKPQWVTFEDVFAAVGAPPVDDVIGAEKEPFGEWFRNELLVRLRPDGQAETETHQLR